MDKDSLYVVFENTQYNREVAFITHCEDDVNLFFKRPSRHKSHFYIKTKDKKEIARFEKDFSDAYCEIEGEVCLTASEYSTYSEAFVVLVDNLLNVLKYIVEHLEYIQFTENELAIVQEMLKILFLRIRIESAEYMDDDSIEDYDIMENDDAFNKELLLKKFLDDIGA